MLCLPLPEPNWLKKISSALNMGRSLSVGKQYLHFDVLETLNGGCISSPYHMQLVFQHIRVGSCMYELFHLVNFVLRPCLEAAGVVEDKLGVALKNHLIADIMNSPLSKQQF
jgi:hypothetical protein